MTALTSATTADTAFKQIMVLRGTIHGTCQQALQQVQSPFTVASYGRQCYDLAMSSIPALTSLAQVPGLEDYAKLVTGNQNYDIISAVSTVIGCQQAFADWLKNAWPKDGSGNAILFTFPDNGPTQDVTFAAEQLAPLIPLLNNAIAATT